MKNNEKLMVRGFRQFGGKHCMTTALKNLFDYHGLHLSEEMLFGLGSGAGFIYWYMKRMPSPFIGTRYGKINDSLINTCKRIGAEATIFQTTSAAKGYEELKKLLREGEPAFVLGDMAYLPYFALPGVAHFGGHALVVYGLSEQEDRVYISDCADKPVTVSIEDLNKARNSKFPPFPPKNKLLKIRYPAKVRNLEKGIREAIGESCANMLKPPIKNIGLAGIKKWAGLVPKWPRQFQGLNLFGCLLNTFIYIEVSGTGGSAFRTMYAQFLRESSTILDEPRLSEVAKLFEDSGKVWTEIATAALPDSWHALKKTRELSFEKNRIFREQPPGALEKMRKINIELEDLMKEAVEELQKKDIEPLLTNLQQKILECHEIESRTFEKLDSIIKQR